VSFSLFQTYEMFPFLFGRLTFIPRVLLAPSLFFFRTSFFFALRRLGSCFCFPPWTVLSFLHSPPLSYRRVFFLAIDVFVLPNSAPPTFQILYYVDVTFLCFSWKSPPRQGFLCIATFLTFRKFPLKTSMSFMVKLKSSCPPPQSPHSSPSLLSPNPFFPLPPKNEHLPFNRPLLF